MLDERREAMEYLYDLESTENGSGRLQVTEFTHSAQFLGLERIMTTIARYFIFEASSDIGQGIHKAEAALRLWLGFGDDVPEDEAVAKELKAVRREFPHIEGWLGRYLEMHKDELSDPEKVFAKMDKKLEKDRVEFAKSSLFKRTDRNDYKRIRYDKIISNAIARGPFRRFYLVCSDNSAIMDGVALASGKKLKVGNIHFNYLDRLWKTVAAYLLERERKGKHGSPLTFEPFNFCDLTMWASARTRLCRTDLTCFFVHGRPLFEIKSGSTNNLVKIKPDEEWFENCGWQIIDVTDGEEALDEYLKKNPGAVFFRDDGGDTLLIPGLRYDH